MTGAPSSSPRRAAGSWTRCTPTPLSSCRLPPSPPPSHFNQTHILHSEYWLWGSICRYQCQRGWFSFKELPCDLKTRCMLQPLARYLNLTLLPNSASTFRSALSTEWVGGCVNHSFYILAQKKREKSKPRKNMENSHLWTICYHDFRPIFIFTYL